MQEELVFDDAPVTEVKVKIGDVRYIMREAGGPQAIALDDFKSSQMKLGPDGRLQSLRLGALDAYLISLCLYEVLGDNSLANKPVPLEQVKTFRPKVIRILAAKLKDMSELNELDTIEMLDKEIEKLKIRREKLVNDKAESLAKNEQSVNEIGLE